jgi:modulator of FtsH protease
MASYSPLTWHDFFLGTIGAAAALTGLLFVAISINLEQILKYPNSRAEQPEPSGSW